MLSRRAQQEMVGFVLIVILVVVGLIVLLVVSLNSSDETADSADMGNFLSVLMRTTSECAIIYEPNYETYGDLFRSCYGGKQCSNLGVSACDYLNETLSSIVEDVFASESAITYYSLKYYSEDEEGSSGILEFEEGNCSGQYSGNFQKLDAGSEDLVIQINVCKG